MRPSRELSGCIIRMGLEQGIVYNYNYKTSLDVKQMVLLGYAEVMGLFISIGYTLISIILLGQIQGWVHVSIFEFVFEYIHYVHLYFNWKSQTCIYLYLIVVLFLQIQPNTRALGLPTKGKA